MGKSIEYEGSQMATVIWVPKNVVKLKVKAKCKDGTKMEMVLGEEGIEECRNNYLSINPNDGAFDLYDFTSLFKRFINDGGSIYDPNGWEEYRKKYEKGREE